MKKKLIFTIVASVVALALLITATVLIIKGVFGKETTGNPVLTVGTVEGKIGDTVTVPIKISNNPGFMAIGLIFDYNQSELEYVGYDKGNILSDYEFNLTDRGLNFLALEDKDVKKNGTIVKLKFKITKMAQDKNPIGITLMPDGICNSKLEAYDATINSGSVNLK